MKALHRASASTRRRRGFSLLELMIAISVMSVGLLGFTQAMVTALRAQLLARQQAIATEAARRQIEIMGSTQFSEVFRRFNGATVDDPAGVVVPGANFAVPGLTAQVGDADGMAGEVLFPVDSVAPEELREDIANTALGTPLDLDVDGAVDGVDHSNDYQMLPVVVIVRWRGAAGEGQIQLETILGED
ncbi:MAG: prepilin-type N-terminal cleavage/methylation domain-containing protein [Planctomycetota bacterium]|nr:prepilin-type N-terminal cleavage/methylation domain-containing protein [Planctomycetota bacterium]